MAAVLEWLEHLLLFQFYFYLSAALILDNAMYIKHTSHILESNLKPISR